MRERLAADEVHVWRASLDVDTEALEPTLDRDEREQASRLATSALRRHFVARRGLRRAVLAAYAGAAPEHLRFRHGPAGKPELADAGLRFSCSSSGDVALVAVARDRRIGVDVERLRRVADPVAIARWLLPHDERIAVETLAGPERDAAFLRAWTRIEARGKACGTGLGRPAFGDWVVQPLVPDRDHLGALAVEGSDWRWTWRAW